MRADGRFDVHEVGDVGAGEAHIRAAGAHYAAIVVFLKAADVMAAPPLQWSGFSGLRVMYDHDVFYNYSSLGALQGRWTRAFADHGFELLVCTGRRTFELLTGDGIDAEWVPKGYDPQRFFDLDEHRGGLCTFGARYPARAAVSGYLRTNGIPLARLEVPYLELNARLNEFESCLVCNFDGRYHFGRAGQRASKLRGGVLARHLLHPLPAFETMLKNYEAAAAGCAVFCDPVPELTELGFVDGDTVILYANFAELVEQVRRYDQEPDELRAIGARGAALCAERHTWAHRVDQLAGILERRLA
jgi:hypothetical protein